MSRWVSFAIAVMLLVAGCADQAPPEVLARSAVIDGVRQLPEPGLASDASLEMALAERRSGRSFAADDLPIEVIGQLLWAAQGITDDAGHRTAPSAGALYPLETYAVTPDEVMHYEPVGHEVEWRSDPRPHDRLGEAAFEQLFVSAAPVVIVLTGTVERTEARYGAVASDLMNREAGHAAQNVLLQAVALDLAATPVGGFDPAEVAELLGLLPNEEPLYLIPIGHPAG